MVRTADIILVGPEPKQNWYRGVSLSGYIFSKMKSRNPDEIIQVKSIVLLIFDFTQLQIFKWLLTPLQVNAETGKQTSNHELLKLSVQIAEALIRLGLKNGDIVALAGRNSDQLHASALGTLFASGVFAAVEPGMKSCKFLI